MPRTTGLTSLNQRVDANMCFNSGAIVIGATATAFTTGAAINYSVDGTFYQKTAMTNQALAAPAGFPALRTQPANTTAFYTLALDAAGNPVVFQGGFKGELINNPISGMSVYGDGVIPDAPDGFTPFAVMKIVSGGAAFVPGTTALTGIATFRNVSVLPAADTF